jgi:hypothetical protein
MTVNNLDHVRRGNFVWCLRIHEDKLRPLEDQQGVVQYKETGGEERVGRYIVEGKLRPALVLLASPECRDVLVWYTHTACDRKHERWVEVTHLTRPGGEKRSFLDPEGSRIRRVPRTGAWCGSQIRALDKAVVAGFLERAAKIPMFRI